MPDGPNVAGMVADPDFQGLAPADKRAALTKLTGDKSFASLNDGETMQFVSRFKPPPPAPAQNPINASLSKATSIGPAPGIVDQLRAGQVPGLNELQQGYQSAGQPAPGTTGLAPQPTLMGKIGQTAGMLVKNPASQALAATVAPQTADTMIPSTARAGGAMNEIRESLGQHTIDVAEPGNTALRAKQIAESGGRMPKVLNDFLRRATDPNKGPMTLAEGRDFYTNATKLASGEFQQLTGPIKAQVAEFVGKLGNSLNEAVARAGRGTALQDAINEYSSAKNMQGLLKKGAAAVGLVGAEELARRGLQKMLRK